MILAASCSMPTGIINLLRAIYRAVLILAPLLIVLFSAVDMMKAVMAGKTDVMEKNKNNLIKRIIIGIIVFFVYAIVKWSFSTILKPVEGAGDAWTCAASILK